MLRFQNKSNVSNIVCEYTNTNNQQIKEFNKRELNIYDNITNFKSYQYYKYTMNQYKTSTFCFENPIKIPDGLTAYTCKVNKDNGNVSNIKITSKIIPAKTGIVLMGEPGEYLIEVLNSDYKCEPIEENDLIGVIENTLIEINVNAYILNVENDKLGWYLLSSTDRTLAKYKAYIVIN